MLVDNEKIIFKEIDKILNLINYNYILDEIKRIEKDILFADKENKHRLAIHFDVNHGKMTIDRTQTDQPFAESFGTTRSLSIPKNKPLKLQVFTDHSIAEIFVNEGEQVATSRVFSEKEANHLFIEGQTGNFDGTIWDLRSSLSL